jgi:DNA-binding transcriptional regulator YdaS (Cro superfamily)
MRLDEYMREQKLGQASLGAKLNPPVTQGAISQWMRGEVRVRLDYALQIEALTGGRVTPKECADLFRSSTADQPVTA